MINCRQILWDQTFWMLSNYVCFGIVYYVEMVAPQLIVEQYVMPIKILMLILVFFKFYELVRVYDTISYFLYLVVNTIKEIQHKLYIFVIF